MKNKATTASPSKTKKIGLAVISLAIGKVVSRAARPMAGKLATRFGMPVGTAIRITEVTMPLLVSLVVQTWARRRAGAGGAHAKGKKSRD